MIFPSIYSVDVETSISWYEHFSGFQCVFKNKIKNPEHAILEKNGMKIFINSSEDEMFTKGFMVIETNDIKKEYQNAEAKGVIFTTGIENGFYGKKQFIVKDYDHNKIIYIQSA